MADAFLASSKSIGALLGSDSREKISVPRFQRGYMWLKRHVDEFWRDVTKYQNDVALGIAPDKYFLGPIVLMRESREVISVLDGQQRLATSTILFSVLRDIARSTGIKAGTELAQAIQSQLITKGDAGYSLEMGETDNLYFQETIQLYEPTKRKAQLRTHRNIASARKVLFEKVTSLTAALDPPGTLAILRGLLQTLRSDLVMASIPVDTERDAFQIFETLNHRGLRLSTPDLLLNFLMREAPESDRATIRSLWTDMMERMGTHDTNRFLRHLWVSRYGDLKKEDLFNALKKHIEEQSIATVDFARTCADECESYVQIITLDAGHLGQTAASLVRSLLQEISTPAVLPLLLSTYTRFDRTSFESVVRLILVFVTRYSVIANLDASGLEDVFYKLAREVRSMTEDPKTEKDETQSFDATAIKKCLAHIKNVLTENAPTDEDIKLAVPKLILEPGEAKYIMEKLAWAMQTDTKEIKIGEANLEHIYPKNPAENEWGGKTNQEVLDPYLWNIGNLTMLGRRLNRKAANKEFSVKRQHYEQKSELDMAQQIAKDYVDWNETAIKDRATKLTNLVLEVWDFDNSSRV